MEEAPGNEMDVRGQTVASVESSPQGTVRRWIAELEMAEKSAKEWIDEAKSIWKIYESGKTKKYAFNILWSNTDTLRPAVFSSLPMPDVRRRFRDADPVGKAASTVLERTLSYEMDQYDAESVGNDVALDMLLCGRGTMRVRYEPLMEGDQVLDEIVPWEHVQWDDFRHGPGKRWEDVRWIAFGHQFTRETAEQKFGAEIAAKLEYVDAEHAKDGFEKDQRSLFQTVRVWEIWDKDERRVLFIAPCYKDGPCLTAPDPLELTGFWPMPKPAYAVQHSGNLCPIPLYRLYKEQAEELNRVSERINKVVNALKVRGAYMAQQTELEKVIEAADNQMVPVQNLSGVADMGGLEKAIWIMPIDKLERVLVALYQARDQIKATIYEITGISDIMRSSTAPSESATAQKLKSEWGTMRLRKMQKEIQRVLRDAMRLQTELYAQRYDQARFAAITGVQLPTQQQKQMAQQQMAMAQQMAPPPQAMAAPAQPGGPSLSAAPSPGMPAPPPIPPQVQAMMALPTWEEVMAVLKGDGMRTYRIDVETDSTVKDVLQQDMMGLAEVTEAIGQLIAGAAPAVQSGMLPVDVPKEVALSIARRARLGTAVEDALDKIQPPPPMQQVDPEQQKQMEAGQKEVEAGKADIQKQQMGLAEQHRGMIEQQLQFVTKQAQQAMKEAETHKVRADELSQREPADKVFQTMLAQLMEAQQATQALVQQSMEAIQAVVTMAAQQNQSTSDAVMTALQQNASAMGAAVEAITAPKAVTLVGPGGKQWTAQSQTMKH